MGQALAAVTGAAAPPRLRESGETPAGAAAQPSASCVGAGRVPDGFPRAPGGGLQGPGNPQAGDARGRCTQGEGRRSKTRRMKANFQGLPQPPVKGDLADIPFSHRCWDEGVSPGQAATANSLGKSSTITRRKSNGGLLTWGLLSPATGFQDPLVVGGGLLTNQMGAEAERTLIFENIIY